MLSINQIHRYEGENVDQRLSIAVRLVAVLSLAACATPISIRGDTKAGDPLKSDTARQVSMWARVETKCDHIESIETQVISVNPIGTGNSEGARKYGSVNERWVVNLCGKPIPFAITFTPDGEGGTFFNISREAKETTGIVIYNRSKGR
jgi:hypothetical protein